MTKTSSPLKDGTISLTLKIDKAEIAKAYQQVLLESAKQVELKGFRKGKAPLNLVESSLDKTKLYSRVLELVLPPAYSREIKAGKHAPLIEPKITPVKMAEGKDWEFTAETAEAPEVRVGDYQKYLKKALTGAKPPKDVKEQENWKLRVVLETILKHAKVTPSPILIEEEAHTQIHKLESQLSQLKLSLPDYLKSIKKTREELDQEYHQTATNNIRLEFALKAIVTELNPSVTTKELEALKPTKDQLPYAKYLLQKQKVLDTLTRL